MFKPINHIVKIYVTFSLQNIKKFGKGIEKPRILVICMQLMAWWSQGHIYVTPTLGFLFTNKLSINNYFDVFSLEVSVNSYSTKL